MGEKSIITGKLNMFCFSSQYLTTFNDEPSQAYMCAFIHSCISAYSSNYKISFKKKKKVYALQPVLNSNTFYPLLR